jgi:hypothetical protein
MKNVGQVVDNLIFAGPLGTIYFNYKLTELLNMYNLKTNSCPSRDSTSFNHTTFS